MATIERIYNVPLRKAWLKQPKYKRAKRAVNALKEFIARTMRVDIANVFLGNNVNMKIWERGIKSPPHHVKVNVTKTDDNLVKVELEDFKYIEKKTISKKEEKKAGLAGKLQELKEATAKEEPKEEAVKKEEPKHEHKKEEPKKEHQAEKKPEQKKEEHKHKEAPKHHKK